MAEINVTPLVDVMLVLLIIFMVTAPLLTAGVPVNLPDARAKALALTAEPLMAEKAADWGLIWKAVEDADLMAEAETLARSLAAGPTLGLGLTKRLIQQAATNSLDQQLDAERDCQQQAGRSADYAEGVTAFLEKRPARFTGK